MILGIDLGTTNSLVGVWRDGQAVLIPNPLGRVLTPSVVGVGDDGAILVGQAARERLVTHPSLTASMFKRYMGTDRKIKLKDAEYRPEDLSALILGALKRDAEAFLGESVSEAVITVPAYFNDAQRKATKIAGQLAGLKVDQLLTEPTAAALAYGFTGADEENTILVIDLGGGTLDISLLHSFEGIMEVKATTGDIWLGGEDFTDVVIKAFLGDKKLEGLDASTMAALRRQAELAKRALGAEDHAEINVNVKGTMIRWALSRERFELMSEPLMTRLRVPLDRALRDARMDASTISRIILAGGAARMPMIRRLVTRLFRHMPLMHIDPDEVVARGAAVRAGLIESGSGLEEHVLTDVTPFTLGVEVSNRTAAGGLVTGLFLPIIERNSTVPLSRSHILATVADNQTKVVSRIYQGESRFVRDNVFLGELTVPLPAAPAGKERIDVRFTYDNSGLLEVDVTVLSTGVKRTAVIEGNPGVLTRIEIEQRLKQLAKLKIHPRELAANTALLARATRLYEEMLGDTRELVGRQLDNFTGALESQRPEDIEQNRNQLTQLLDSLDKSFV